MNEPQTIRAKYKGYCFKCHHTIWLNELVHLTGKVRHIDCKVALKDKTPRQLDSRYLGIYGKTSPKKLKKLIKILNAPST